MKKFALPVLVLLSVTGDCLAQDTKRITESSGSRYNKIVTEYYVLADDKSVKHGSYKQYRNDARLLSGGYKMNKKDSTWTRFANNGSVVISETFYANGVKTGIWKFYKPDGGIEWQFDFNTKSGNYPKFRGGADSCQNENGEWVKAELDIGSYWLNSTYEWQSFLNRNLRYPQEAIDKNIQGTAVIEVTVDENGDGMDYRIYKSTHPALDNEALRVIKLYEPEFVPAEKNGKKVKVKFTIPIVFRLEAG